MEQFDNLSYLPTVTEVDISIVEWGELDDPRHLKRWSDLVLSNKALSDAIRKRASLQARLVQGEHEGPLAINFLDMASFVVAILETAAAREQLETAIDVDDGDAGQQP